MLQDSCDLLQCCPPYPTVLVFGPLDTCIQIYVVKSYRVPFRMYLEVDLKMRTVRAYMEWSPMVTIALLFSNWFDLLLLTTWHMFAPVQMHYLQYLNVVYRISSMVYGSWIWFLACPIILALSTSFTAGVINFNLLSPKQCLNPTPCTIGLNLLHTVKCAKYTFTSYIQLSISWPKYNLQETLQNLNR